MHESTRAILDFIVAIVSATVWPAVALFITFLFRHQLSGFMDSLERFTIGSLTLTAKKDMEHIRETNQSGASLPECRGNTCRLLRISTVLSIIQKWTELEWAILELSTEAAITNTPTKRYVLVQILHRLEKRGLIDHSTLSHILRLWRVRNAAISGDIKTVSESDAIAFMESADALCAMLLSAVASSRVPQNCSHPAPHGPGAEESSSTTQER